MIKISVIIAAYNAADFIRKAVESATILNEVKEIIIVEDCSTDNTLLECKRLEKEYQKVKVYQHPDNKNKGAGASWNLGIKKSNHELLAILGADDYFLPDRFEAENEIYNKDSGPDGVYGALGTHYYSPEAKILYEQTINKDITTIKEIVPAEELAYVILSMHNNVKGHFSLDAFTIKKELLKQINFFNENLRLHQDTDFIIKASIKGNLVPGIIDRPIAMRGVHKNNRITNIGNKHKSQYELFSELNKWINSQDKISSKIINFIETKKNIYEILFLEQTTIRRISKFYFLIKNRPYLFYLNSEFNFILKSVMGDNLIIKILLKIKVFFVKILSPNKIRYYNKYYFFTK